MKIAIDGTCWHNKRGFGRFTRDLLTALFDLDRDHEYILFVDQKLEGFSDHRVNVIYVEAGRPTTQAAVANGRRSIRDLIRLGNKVSSHAPDVVFYPAVYSWFPVRPGLRVAITLHDAIAEHYPEMIFPDRKSRFLWTLKMKLALLQSDRILTVSNAAKQEIVEYLRVNPAAIDVIGEGASSMFCTVATKEKKTELRAKLGLPLDSRLIIYVGGLAPHKNLEGFLHGFSKAKTSGAIPDVNLVLVGDYDGAGFHSNYHTLKRQVDSSLELKSAVHFPGFVSDEDLVLLYNDALAAAMPSFSEGFGLPALEAMCCGIPILSSLGGSLPEIVGTGGLYFDPYDNDAIARSILKLCTDSDLQDQLSKLAFTQSKRFSWKKSAEQTLAILEDVGR